MDPLLKITFVSGLLPVVRQELETYENVSIVATTESAVYVAYTEEYELFHRLRSASDVYVVERNILFSPRYIASHKSLLGNHVEKLCSKNTFISFSLSCAGSNSSEVESIKQYLTERYGLKEEAEADMKIYIGKEEDMWELGISTTTRPLSFRTYKKENMKGALNPTIAYAMNTYAHLSERESYLNIFSGSGTLLIEAGLENPTIRLTGLDANAKNNTLAIQNIQSAGLISRVKLTTADIFTAPDIGTFDVISADLPFGMSISKGENLSALYAAFIHYAQNHLAQHGVMVAYTSEYELLLEEIKKSKIVVTDTLDLTLSTVIGRYLRTKIIVGTLG